MGRRTGITGLGLVGAAGSLGVAVSCLCVAEGTPVLTPKGERAIESLRVGDSIYAYDVRCDQLVATRVTAIRGAVRECVAIETDDRRLICTPDHPVYCPREQVYADAGDWALGRRREVLVVEPGLPSSIEAARGTVYVGLRRVFDITVEHELHNFVASGLLVHNKVVEPPDVAFRCDPAGRDPACPEGYQCCSDDPATLDGDLPDYFDERPGSGPALFSGPNNELSGTGMCVKRDLLAPGSGLFAPGGCPIPCNPRWDATSVETVCGPESLCCQTVELTDSDCVLADGCWRPATGDDIFDAEVAGDWGEGPDPWGKKVHETAQDPDGRQCESLANGDQALFESCLRSLTVADQRGYCLAQSEIVQECPLDDPYYIDPCERRNLDEGRACPDSP